MSAPQETTTFVLADAAVRVVDRSGDVLAWLRETFLPAFSELPTEACAPRILSTVVADPSLDVGAMTEATSTPAWAMERGVLSIAGEPTAAGIALADDETGATYLIAGDQVAVGTRTTVGALRFGTSRVTRELLVTGLAGTPHAVLHASALAAPQGVVLLAGDRESGKTTTMAHLVASTGTPLVANDRVVVFADHVARGVPTVINVRAGTAELLPVTVGPLFARGRTPHLTMAEARLAADADRAPKTVPSSCSLAQLAEALGVELAAGGPVAAIGFLRPERARRPFSVRRLSEAEAGERSAAHRFGRRSSPRALTVFEEYAGLSAVPDDAPMVLASLAARVPCYDVTVGPSLAASPLAAQALLGALLARP